MTALAGRVAVVTGASRGIGRAVADRLVKAGASVARLARFRGGTGSAGEFACDVTDEADVERAAARVRDALGPADLLVHCAGAFVLQAFAETSVATMRAQLETNLVGAFAVYRAFVPDLMQQGGHAVTVGSIADHLALPGNAAYAASKYGLRGLHEVLAAETRGSGVRMTLISPGATDTTAWDPVDPDGRDDLPDRSAMLRPEDVADAVFFAVTRPAHANVDLLWLNPSG